MFFDAYLELVLVSVNIASKEDLLSHKVNYVAHTKDVAFRGLHEQLRSYQIHTG